MVVTSSTYLADITKLIRDALLSGMTDPNSGARSGQEKFVVTAWPARNAVYPIVIIVAHGATDGKRLGMRSVDMQCKVPITITVFGRDAKEKDTIAQNVEHILRTIQLTATTGTVANEAFGLKIISTADDDEIDGSTMGLNIRKKIINVEYMILLTGS